MGRIGCKNQTTIRIIIIIIMKMELLLAQRTARLLHHS